VPPELATPISRRVSLLTRLGNKLGWERNLG